MIENFDYEKGQEFLNKTKQPLNILNFALCNFIQHSYG